MCFLAAGSMIGSMTIGVYGMGRFGAFWADALSARHHVIGYNRSPGREIPERVTVAEEDEVLASDALFLCVSISSLEDVVSRIAPRIPDNTVVLDTCSVKVHPVQVLARTFPRSQSLVGTHPMFGPDSARDGLSGLPVVVCPVEGKRELARQWGGFFGELGLDVHFMEAEEHDREAAFTQGIAHLIGRVLGNLELQASPMATLGYRKLLDVVEQTCNDPWQLFVDLQRYNPYSSQVQSDVARSFEAVFSSLREEEGRLRDEERRNSLGGSRQEGWPKG